MPRHKLETRTRTQTQVPEICGYDCPFAQFPPAETAGICRTMSAVLCGKLTELVNKNVPCEWRRREALPAATNAFERAAGPKKAKSMRAAGQKKANSMSRSRTKPRSQVPSQD